MLSKFYSLLKNAIDFKTLRTRAEVIHALERNYGQRAFHQSAYCCEQFLRADGFQDVQRIAIPCDGKATALDAVMPQAWDRTGRSFFRIESPQCSDDEALLSDTNLTPFAAGMWSLPTPPNGIRGEIVDWDALPQDSPDVKGKIVLLFRPDYQVAYRYCNAHGAAAMLLCDARLPKETMDDTRWANGNGNVGWYHTKEDKRGIFFPIPPRKAFFLRELLKRHKKVVGYGVMSTRVYDDVIHTVTGVIPGKSKKEIALVAHIYEPFITDDAIGAAQIIAVAGAIRALAEQGKIPPLKHTIRVLIGMERFGFSHWFADRENAKRTIHLFSFDSSSHHPEIKDGKKLVNLRLTHQQSPSFVDWILLDTLQRQKGIQPVPEAGNLSDDTYVSGPLLNIPSSWIHVHMPLFHHNSNPAFSKPNWEILPITTSALATGILPLACFGKDEFLTLAPALLQAAQKEHAETLKSILTEAKAAKPTDANFYREKAHFLTDCTVERLLSLNQYAPHTFVAKELALAFHEALHSFLEKLPPSPVCWDTPVMQRAKNLVLTPIEPGPAMSLAKVPHKERQTVPFPPMFASLSTYCDGTISLFEAARKNEFALNFRYKEQHWRDLIQFAKITAKYGYFTIKPQFHPTQKELADALRKLGVKAGQKLVVHSSFSSLGELQGGPTAVPKALMNVIGPKGLLLMPAFNFFTFPEDGVFDPKTTHTVIGAVSDAFWQMPGVFRSLAPTHSFAAWGAGAEEILAGHEKTCTLGEDSPLGRLEAMDGYGLLIQCPTALTFKHTVELTNQAKCLHPAGEHYPVRMPNGKVKDVVTWSWRNENCHLAQMEELWPLMFRKKLVRSLSFANAQMLLFKLKDFRKCYEQLLHGKDGCKNCKNRPRIVEATLPEVRRALTH